VKRNRFLVLSVLLVAALALVLAGCAKEKPVSAGGQKTLKAGFVYVGPIGDLGFTNAHDVVVSTPSSSCPG
jgi:simple sugar transport system substrate-binding protein